LPCRLIRLRLEGDEALVLSTHVGMLFVASVDLRTILSFFFRIDDHYDVLSACLPTSITNCTASFPGGQQLSLRTHFIWNSSTFSL
jgi:hypothetical protein